MAQCKVCLVDKPKVAVEIPGKATKFIDDRGKRWNGNACSVCANAKRLEYFHKVHRPKEIAGEAEVRTYFKWVGAKKTHRNCRKCSIKLPPTRYFHCNQCVPAYTEYQVNGV